MRTLVFAAALSLVACAPVPAQEQAETIRVDVSLGDGHALRDTTRQLVRS